MIVIDIENNEIPNAAGGKPPAVQEGGLLLLRPGGDPGAALEVAQG